MLTHELLDDLGILVVRPEGTLEATDFAALSQAIDPYIEKKGRLRGLMVCAESFSGWEDFASFLSHTRFIKQHSKVIERVAVVTDSRLMHLVQAMVDQFVVADVVHFEFDKKDEAFEWLSRIR